jgi:hypothetical protein
VPARRLIIVDLRDEFIDKIWVLFVVMLSIFANTRA